MVTTEYLLWMMLCQITIRFQRRSDISRFHMGQLWVTAIKIELMMFEGHKLHLQTYIMTLVLTVTLMG